MSAYRTSYAVAATLTCLLTAGCAGNVASDPAPTYVGKVTDPGQDAAVALVSDGSKVTFYLCGGPLSFDKITRWFQGDVGSDGMFALEKSGGFTVTGDVGAGTGVLTTDVGQELAWTVRPTENEEEGLYSAMDGSCRTGAIVGDLEDNGTVRLQGTWCDGEGRFAQVSPLAPAHMLTTTGIDVRVNVSPAKSLYVDRVVHP